MGVRAEVFWDMNPRKLRPYSKAKELQEQEVNRHAHLLGSYIYEAVSIAVCNAFRKSGSKPVPYREKPYDLITSDDELRAKKQYEKAMQMKNKFMAWAVAHNNNFKQKGGDG